MTTIRQDIRYGIRTLRDRPAFTLVATLSLALGIGANATIFSIINATLLAPLGHARVDQGLELGQFVAVGEHFLGQPVAIDDAVADRAGEQRGDGRDQFPARTLQ